MGGELLIATNPHRRKGRRTAAQKSASLRNIKKAQRARRGHSTRRRRHNPETRSERSRAAKLGWRRRRHNPESRSERSRAAKLGWSRRRHHTHHRRRHNPVRSRGLMGFVEAKLLPAAVGATGAVVNDVSYNLLLGLLPANTVTTQLTTGPLRHAGKAFSALSLTWLAAMFLHPKTADELGAGALTVVGYNIAKDVVGKFAPHLPLGCYDGAGGGMGAYVDGYASPGAGAGTLDMRTNPNPQLAAYVNSQGVGISPQLTQPAGVQLEGYQEGY